MDGGWIGTTNHTNLWMGKGEDSLSSSFISLQSLMWAIIRVPLSETDVEKNMQALLPSLYPGFGGCCVNNESTGHLTRGIARTA